MQNDCNTAPNGAIGYGEDGLREIRDDLYLFSTARVDFGTVIARRERKRRNCIGSHVSDVLGIGDTGQSAFYSMKDDADALGVTALCYDGGEPEIALLLNPFLRDAAMGMAIRLDLPAVAVVRVLERGLIPYVSLTDDVAYEFEGAESDPLLERDAYLYLSKLIMSISYVARSSHINGDSEPIGIESAAEQVSVLVGVKITLSTRILTDAENDREQGGIISRDVIVATLFFLAVVAREMSIDRELRLCAEVGRESLALRYSFYSKERIDGYAEVLERIAGGLGLFSFCNGDGDERIFEIVPQYSDVGLIGVKQDANELL